MNMNKPLVQQWKDNLTRSILPQAIAAGLLVLLTIFTLSAFAGFSVIAVVLGVFLIVDINKEYKVYKYSLRALESESDLGRRLQLAFNKVYETETVEFGAITEFGIVTDNGWAPWQHIKQISVRSKETKFDWPGLLLGYTAIRHDPCYLTIYVEPDPNTRYQLKVLFVQNRDVAREIEKYTQQALIYNKNITIDNTYNFVK